jgi:hypothetical protein
MATADQYAEWIVSNADKRGSKDFDTVVKAYEEAKREALPTGDQMPGPRVPDWAKESPNLYSAASTAADIGIPIVEIGLPVAGAVLGAGGTSFSGPGSLVGAAAGAGIGEGIAGEIKYGTEVALGRREPRSVMEGVTEPMSNVAFGATTEGVGGKVLDFAGKTVGRVVDAVRGGASKLDIKARNMVRESLNVEGAPGVDTMSSTLRNAPENLTARQAGSTENAPLFQALGKLGEKQKSVSSSYPNIMKNQASEDIADMAELAGGVTQLELQQARDATFSRLTSETKPMREGSLGRANELGTLEPALRSEATILENAASSSVDDVRRFTAAKDRAQVRANQTDPNVWSQQYENYMKTGIPELAEKRMEQAANGSLEFGQAARFAESAADSLRNAGVEPLEGMRIADAVRALIKDPKYAGLSERAIALNRVAKDIEEYTNAGGLIDADALDAIRKNSVNAVFQSTTLSPKAKMAAVANTMTEIRPLLIDAIENAGGKGYRQYLTTYADGMDRINRKELMGVALQLYANNPAKFIKLVDGDDIKTVRKTLGYNMHNIAEVGEEAMAILKRAAKTLATTKESLAQLKDQEKALESLLSEFLPLIRLPSFLSAKVTATNTALDILEKKIGKKVMSKLGHAYKSGKRAAALLDVLTSYERFQLMSAYMDPQLTQFMRSSATFGSVGAYNALTNKPLPQQNQLAR